MINVEFLPVTTFCSKASFAGLRPSFFFFFFFYFLRCLFILMFFYHSLAYFFFFYRAFLFVQSFFHSSISIFVFRLFFFTITAYHLLSFLSLCFPSPGCIFFFFFLLFSLSFSVSFFYITSLNMVSIIKKKNKIYVIGLKNKRSLKKNKQNPKIYKKIKGKT